MKLSTADPTIDEEVAIGVELFTADQPVDEEVHLVNSYTDQLTWLIDEEVSIQLSTADLPIDKEFDTQLSTAD